jgi:hypothetical protein
MRLATLEDLAYPGGLGKDLTESSLLISPSIPLHIEKEGNAAEVLEAIIRYGTCEREFPVAADVSIAVPDIASYLRRQFASVVSNCALCGGISSHLIDYMLARGYNPAQTESREYYDSRRKLNTYICAHYDNITRLVLPNNSLGRYLCQGYHVFYSSVLKLWEQAVPSTFERREHYETAEKDYDALTGSPLQQQNIHVPHRYCNE